MTIDALTRTVLPLGLSAFITPEFKGITIGGAISGAALESASFRYGQCNDTCLAYQVAMPNEERLTATPENHAPLFHALPGSYGTLGNVTAVQLQLRPCKAYVSLNYEWCDGPEETVAKLRNLIADRSFDYLDAIVLSRECGVVMAGREHEQPQGQVLYLDRPYSPWFCQHLFSVAREQPAGITLPLYDYLFRLDRGAFWMGRYLLSFKTLIRALLHWHLEKPGLSDWLRTAFSKLPDTIEPNVLLRTLLTGLMSSSALYRLLHALPRRTFAETFLVQDYYLPEENVSSFLSSLLGETPLYPIWLCPIRSAGASQQPFSPHGVATQPLINVGVYGSPSKPHSIPELTRHLENLTETLRGRKMLYGVNLYPEEQFWRIYPHDTLRSLQRQYGIDPSNHCLYRKVHSDLQEPCLRK